MVTQRGQMLDRLTNSMEVIDANIADSGTSRSDVDKYQRHPAQFQVLKQHFFHAERHDSNAFDPAFDHPPDDGLHAGGVISGRSQHNLVVVLNRNAFEHLDDLGKERVGDLGNDEPENPAASRNERASLSVRIITKFFDDVPHSLGELGINGGDPIEGAGYGRGGNS